MVMPNQGSFSENSSPAFLLRGASHVTKILSKIISDSAFCSPISRCMYDFFFFSKFQWVSWCLVLLPHSEKVLGSNPPFGWALFCVLILLVPSVSVDYLLPQSRDKLLVGAIGCLSVSLLAPRQSGDLSRVYNPPPHSPSGSSCLVSYATSEQALTPMIYVCKPLSSQMLLNWNWWVHQFINQT